MDICHQVVGTDERELGELFACLRGIVKVLRSDRGCPWDRRQTIQDVKEFLLEEVYELVSGISKEDWEETQEEIGDLLLLCVFLSCLGEEKKLFSLRGSLNEVIDKLIRRHPHVFGELNLSDPDEVVANWSRIKDQEKKKKGKSSGVWSSVPAGAPAIFQYYTYLKELKKRGKEKVLKEPSLKQEICSVLSHNDLTEKEIGEILLKVVELCYIKGINPETAFLDRITKIRNQEEGGD